MNINKFQSGDYIQDLEISGKYFQLESKAVINGREGWLYREASCWTCEPEPVRIDETILFKLGFKVLEQKGEPKIYRLFGFDFGLMESEFKNFYYLQSSKISLPYAVKYVHEMQQFLNFNKIKYNLQNMRLL